MSPGFEVIGCLANMGYFWDLLYDKFLWEPVDDYIIELYLYIYSILQNLIVYYFFFFDYNKLFNMKM